MASATASVVTAQDSTKPDEGILGLSVGGDPGGRYPILRHVRACGRIYRPRITSIPARTSRSNVRGTFPARSVSKVRSMVRICDVGYRVLRKARDACAKEGVPRRVCPAEVARQGDANDRRNLTEVEAVACTISTGRLSPGPEPVGPGRSAHQISPWAITSWFAGGSFSQHRRHQDRAVCPRA